MCWAVNLGGREERLAMRFGEAGYSSDYGGGGIWWQLYRMGSFGRGTVW